MRLAAILLGASTVCVLALHASERPPAGLDLYRPAPVDNPLTAGSIALGRQLFHDRQLSRDGSVSCAVCHNERSAFSDGRPLAVGVGGARGNRNVPAILNRAWGAAFFWDGRAMTLEQQALEPLLNPREMAMTPDGVLAVARSTAYRTRFVRAFQRDPTIFDVARALASYVRSIRAGDSPYDRYGAGDRRALTAAARRGFLVFMGKAGCTRCHTGPLLSDEQFHNTGIAWRAAADRSNNLLPSDRGRAAVTGSRGDLGAFKTPTLREVARTAPYMHDGSVATLAQVIEYYDQGGEPNPGLDPRLQPLHLSPDEKRELLAFLKSLSGTITEGR